MIRGTFRSKVILERSPPIKNMAETNPRKQNLNFEIRFKFLCNFEHGNPQESLINVLTCGIYFSKNVLRIE